MTAQGCYVGNVITKAVPELEFLPAMILTFFATPYVRPPTIPDTCVPCPKQSFVLLSPYTEYPWMARETPERIT